MCAQHICQCDGATSHRELAFMLLQAAYILTWPTLGTALMLTVMPSLQQTKQVRGSAVVACVPISQGGFCNLTFCNLIFKLVCHHHPSCLLAVELVATE